MSPPAPLAPICLSSLDPRRHSLGATGTLRPVEPQSRTPRSRVPHSRRAGLPRVASRKDPAEAAKAPLRAPVTGARVPTRDPPAPHTHGEEKAAVPMQGIVQGFRPRFSARCTAWFGERETRDLQCCCPAARDPEPGSVACSWPPPLQTPNSGAQTRGSGRKLGACEEEGGSDNMTLRKNRGLI